MRVVKPYRDRDELLTLALELRTRDARIVTPGRRRSPDDDLRVSEEIERLYREAMPPRSYSMLRWKDAVPGEIPPRYLSARVGDVLDVLDEPGRVVEVGGDRPNEWHVVAVPLNFFEALVHRARRFLHR